MEVTAEGLARFFEVTLPHLNEVQRRVVAGAAAELGRGGKTAVAQASTMSRNTVIKAEREVAGGIEPSERLRAEGGGDKPSIDKQPGLLEALDELVHPATRGNPMSLLRWTSKSSTKLADDLVRQGYEVSSRTVLRLLHLLGYSLQANAKVTEGRQHPDRDGQFRYLNDLAGSFIEGDQPVISVDTKKKELIGDYANGDRSTATADQQRGWSLPRSSPPTSPRGSSTRLLRPTRRSATPSASPLRRLGRCKSRVPAPQGASPAQTSTPSRVGTPRPSVLSWPNTAWSPSANRGWWRRDRLVGGPRGRQGGRDSRGPHGSGGRT